MRKYYEKILDKVKELNEEGKKKEALELLDHELNMPYVPEIYEKQFEMLFEIITHDQKPKKESVKIHSPEKLLEMLFDPKEANKIMALDLLSEINLRPYAKEIKERIQTWEDHRKKVVLFELLSEQEVSISIDWDGRIINPKKTSVFSDDKIYKIIKKLEVNTQKTPQLLEVSMRILSEYVISIFPERIGDLQVLTKDILIIANHLLTGKNKLNFRQQKIEKIFHVN